MTDPSPDVLGLGGTVPGPGWTVLDAARDQRFTGELVAEADVTVRVYFDRGRIYTAERAADPPLGIRLVETGAISHAQLEYGTVRIGDTEYLGRLFDRVPSVNRDGVLVLNALMTEECVGALAAAQVRSVTATPYRHHPSGMHRWGLFDIGTAAPGPSSVPEMAFPAPHPDARPVATSPTAERARDAHLDDTRPHEHRRPTNDDDTGTDRHPTNDDDTGTDRHPTNDDDTGRSSGAPDEAPLDTAFEDLVAQDEPASPTHALVQTATTPSPRPRRSDVLTDEPSDLWIDQPVHEAATDAEVDVGAAPSLLAPPPVRPVEQFEVVWPSGETDDVVDTDEPFDDRVGPTARVPNTGSRQDRPEQPSGIEPDGIGDGADPGDNQLIVRRAVATIDTGSLDARRRLADVSSETAPPGRIVVQRESTVWRGDATQPATSVFDEVPVDTGQPDVDPAEIEVDDEHAGRSSALRRLIDGLKRS